MISDGNEAEYIRIQQFKVQFFGRKLKFKRSDGFFYMSDFFRRLTSFDTYLVNLGPTQVKCSFSNYDIFLKEFLTYFWKCPNLICDIEPDLFNLRNGSDTSQKVIRIFIIRFQHQIWMGDIRTKILRQISQQNLRPKDQAHFQENVRNSFKICRILKPNI